MKTMTSPEGQETETHRRRSLVAILVAFVLMLIPATMGASTASAAPAPPAAAVATQSGGLELAAMASSRPPSPAICAKGDMDDGLTTYDYQYSADGWNYYTYQTTGTADAGTTSCTDNPYVTYGYYTGQDCWANGIKLALGTVFFPGGQAATVGGLFFWGAGCAAEFFFN